MKFKYFYLAIAVFIAITLAVNMVKSNREYEEIMGRVSAASEKIKSIPQNSQFMVKNGGFLIFSGQDVINDQFKSFSGNMVEDFMGLSPYRYGSTTDEFYYKIANEGEKDRVYRLLSELTLDGHSNLSFSGLPNATVTFFTDNGDIEIQVFPDSIRYVAGGDLFIMFSASDSAIDEVVSLLQYLPNKAD